MDLSQPKDYAKLADLRERHAETVVMYLATAPDLFTRWSSSSPPPD
jgi:glucose-6-phosphate 1-dehydrogenase